MLFFQDKEFDNSNLIALDERGVEKDLLFYVNKEIEYGIIFINRINIFLYLVSHVFIIVVYNINFTLGSKKRAIDIELFKLFGSSVFNSEFSKTTCC